MLDKIEDIIEDIRQGKMIIMVDDENRENEGDLLIAADQVSAASINFMATHARGLICLTLTQERCESLGLKLMVNDNNARYATNFTVSIEAAHGVTTGISAADRAMTVQAAVHADAKASDIVTPGHIFPVMAQGGGVLTRAGHTEAGVDLARLAGRQAASAICEILKTDGTMARLPDLLEFGRQHSLRIGSIADLIRYRRRLEPTVKRLHEQSVCCEYGDFKVLQYHDIIANTRHLAFVAGPIDHQQATLVRVHVHTGIFDTLTYLRDSFAWPISRVLETIGKQGGVLVVVHHDNDESELASALQQYGVADAEDNDADGELRMLGIGGQILADLGVGLMRVMGSQKRMHGLAGFDLELTDYIATPDEL